jgi:hypothetical protein
MRLVLTAGIRYGHFNPNASCVSLFDDLDNATGVGWSSLELSVRVSGNGLSVDVPITTVISGDSESYDSIVKLDKSCSLRGWPKFTPDKMVGRFVRGTPDRNDVATFNRRKVAKEKAVVLAASRAKLVSDTVAAYAAVMAKLPLLNAVTFIGADQKCAEQFHQALSMDGLEKRKRMADLVLYRCGFIIDSPVHVRLIATDHGYVMVTIADYGEYLGKTGWVPSALLAAAKGEAK